MTTETTITVTITGKVYSPYGIQYTVGSQQTVATQFGLDLIQQGLATDTNRVNANTLSDPYLQQPIIVGVGTPSDTDGRPNDTIYIQVAS